MPGPQPPGNPPVFHMVTRRDDNGITVMVQDVMTQAGAEALARQLEARAHKQSYAVLPYALGMRDAVLHAAGILR